MLNKYIKAVEWNIKNIEKMTDQDWVAFERLEDHFQTWVETLEKDTKEATAIQIKMVIHALKTFEGSKFRGIWW